MSKLLQDPLSVNWTEFGFEMLGSGQNLDDLRSVEQSRVKEEFDLIEMVCQ